MLPPGERSDLPEFVDDRADTQATLIARQFAVNRLACLTRQSDRRQRDRQ